MCLTHARMDAQDPFSLGSLSEPKREMIFVFVMGLTEGQGTFQRCFYQRPNKECKNCAKVDEMMDTLDLDRDGNVSMDDFMRIFIDLEKRKESRKNSALTKCDIL